MADLVQISLSEPIVESEQPEVTYDKLWLRRLIVTAVSPQTDVDLRAELLVCRDTAEGKELKTPAVTKTICINKLFSMMEDETLSAETRSAIGAAINQLLTALSMYGVEKGEI